MTELYPSDTELAALSGTADSEQEVLFVPTGESPYYISFYKMLHRLLDVARRAGDFRVYKDGDLTFGVRAGRLTDGSTVRDYEGSEGNSLTNNATNYVYLTVGPSGPELAANTTGFPDPATTPNIPLATIATSAGAYTHDDITDYRGRGIFRLLSGLKPGEMNEAHEFFSATDLTGAEAEILSDGSNADALHVHDTAGLADGAVTNAKIAADAAIARSKLAQETGTYSVPLWTARRFDAAHDGLPATAADDDLGLITGTPGTNAPIIETISVSGEGTASAVEKARFFFALPPEYVAGQAVTLRVHVRVTNACNTHSKIDAAVYEQDREGGLSADVCATAEQNITTSWTDKDFTITPTGLAAANVLDITLTLDLDDTGGTSPGSVGEIGSVQLLAAVKG